MVSRGRCLVAEPWLLPAVAPVPAERGPSVRWLLTAGALVLAERGPSVRWLLPSGAPVLWRTGAQCPGFGTCSGSCGRGARALSALASLAAASGSAVVALSRPGAWQIFPQPGIKSGSPASAGDS